MKSSVVCLDIRAIKRSTSRFVKELISGIGSIALGEEDFGQEITGKSLLEVIEKVLAETSQR